MTEFDLGDLRLCGMCHELKPMQDFAFKNLRTGLRQWHCRSCHARYRHKHYTDHKGDYVQRAIVQVERKRELNRDNVVEYLRLHPCVDCGETDIVVLEFDHRERADKVGAVGDLALTRSWPAVREEIEKCDVRCANCHRRRTAAQFGWARAAGYH